MNLALMMMSDGQFQFPPNGKVRVNERLQAYMDEHNLLFQFPPNGKVRVNLKPAVKHYENNHYLFQFPPNGKVRVNHNRKGMGEIMAFVRVSIPSKREGTCEQRQIFDARQHTEFQFPPNGKVRVNSVLITRLKFWHVRKFQFPPNGKVRVNTNMCIAQQATICTDVSIPSKREGTCELQWALFRHIQVF